MDIQRLSWAGIKVVVGSTTVVVDRPIMGEPQGPLFALSAKESIHLGLLTHLHPDHYDPQALRERLAPSGCVVCHCDIRDKP